MGNAAAVEQVLTAWREGERLLEELPPLSPDHESVELAVARLRVTYKRITGAHAASSHALASSDSTLNGAFEAIKNARQRLGEQQRTGTHR